MVASAVFITDLQGKSIISRNYRGDVPLAKAIERFAKYLGDTPDEHKKPVFYNDSNSEFCLSFVVLADSLHVSSHGMAIHHSFIFTPIISPNTYFWFSLNLFVCIYVYDSSPTCIYAP
jgi:hypothetical protein